MKSRTGATLSTLIPRDVTPRSVPSVSGAIATTYTQRRYAPLATVIQPGPS